MNKVRNYELVTIISPEVDEEKVSEVVDKVSHFIGERGGIVDETKQWGRRKLAYPIKRFMEADYMVTRFKLEPKLLRKLEAALRTSEEVLRHLVVRVGR